MKTPPAAFSFPREGVRFLLALLVAAAGLASARASDLDVSGNLTVQGTIDATGNTIQFGTVTGASGTPGLAFTYGDGTNGAVGFSATRPQSSWLWQSNIGGWKPQMLLDGNNRLSLYDLASMPAVAILLNPTGASTFANSLTVNGTDNRMPNQTLADASSVLTRGLADARYVMPGAATTFTTSPTVQGQFPYLKFNGTSGAEMGHIGFNQDYGNLVMDVADENTAIAIGTGRYSAASKYIYIGSPSNTDVRLMSSGGVHVDGPGITISHEGGGGYGADLYNVHDDQGAFQLNSWAGNAYGSARSNFSVMLRNPNNATRQVDVFGAMDNLTPGSTPSRGIIRFGTFGFSPADVYISPTETNVAKFTETSGIYLGLDTGNRVVIGGTSDDGANKLQVQGSATFSGTVTANAIVANGPIHVAPQGDLSMGEFTSGQ